MFKLTFTFGMFNAALGVVCYATPAMYESGGIYFFLFAISSLILYLIHYRWSLLFQARMFLLAVIGYFAGFVKLIDPSLLFSPVEPTSQSFEIGVKMFGLTSLALFGSFIGITLGFRRSVNVYQNPMARISNVLKDWHLTYYLTFAVIVLTGHLSALSYGPTVFQGVYGTGEGQGQSLGNLQSIGVVCTVLNITAALFINRRKFLYGSIVAVSYFFVWGILIRGGRLEVLSGLLAIAICIPLLNQRITRVTKRQMLYIFLTAVFMESWGWLRSALTTVDSEAMFDGYKRLADSGIYFAGTVSGIATSFANTLHMVEGNAITLIFGKSYLEYIPRTPPEFIYPGRPPDYSSMFENYGYAAIGGFFELAEAYLNFGLMGCLFVPLIISFLLSRVYQNAFRGGLFWFLILTAILSVFFRGAWYQSFAFYKSLFTGIGVYLFVMAVISFFRTSLSKQKSFGRIAIGGNK